MKAKPFSILMGLIILALLALALSSCTATYRGQIMGRSNPYYKIIRPTYPLPGCRN